MKNAGEQYQQIIANCWADEDFKKRFLADPIAVLAAEGVTLPEGMVVNIVENSPREITLVIPAAPSSLSDGDLDAVAGGVWSNSNPTMMGETAEGSRNPNYKPPTGTVL
jgi:hypothetical protein